MSATVRANAPEPKHVHYPRKPTGAEPMTHVTPKVKPLTNLRPITLADVARGVAARTDLPTTRKRDLLSAVSRIAALLDRRPDMLELDLVALRKALARISPATHGLKTKTFQNLKSDFLAGIEASGLLIPGRSCRNPDRKVSRDAIYTEAVLANCVDMLAPGIIQRNLQTTFRE